MWAVIGFLTAIGVVVSLRRLVALAGHTAAPEAIDAGFAGHRALTASHIVPGLVFLLSGPVQFMSGIRRRRPALHRWMGRLFVAAALVVGVTALAMSPQMPIGGPLETAASSFFGAFFLVALGKAFVAIRGREFARHRQWMIRTYAIGLAIATIRPIVGVFFATRSLTGLTPRDFFGIAFWLGFTAHAVAAELWIQRFPKPPST